MHTAKQHFLPAAGLHLALPLYDPLLRLTGATRVQRAFVERAGLRPGQRVLEIGCGTGNVSVLAKQACPAAQVVGLDPDARALERARSKAARAGLEVRFDEGYANALPYAADSFDLLLSSFMWHHLPPSVQRATVHELLRVLAPAGELVLIDFARPGRRRSAAHAQSADALCSALAAAGFEAAQVQPEPSLLWMHVFSCRARRPASSNAG